MEKFIRKTSNGNETFVIMLFETDLRKDKRDELFDEISCSSFKFLTREEIKNASFIVYNDNKCKTKILKNRWGSNLSSL